MSARSFVILLCLAIIGPASLPVQAQNRTAAPPPAASAPSASAQITALFQTLQAQIEQLRQQSVDLATKEAALDAREAKAEQSLADTATNDKKLIESNTQALSDFKKHDDTAMGYLNSDASLVTWIISGFSFFVAVIIAFATIKVTTFTQFKFKSDLNNAEREFQKEMDKVRQAVSVAQTTAEGSQEHARAAKRTAGEVQKLLQEVERIRGEVEGGKNAVDACLQRFNAAARTAIRAGVDAGILDQPFAGADAAVMQASADTLATVPGVTPYERSFDTGLRELHAANFDAAEEAFGRAVTEAQGILPKADALYYQAIATAGSITRQDAHGDPVPLLDEVISFESELLRVPTLAPLLAHAHKARAEVMRKRGDLNEAFADYTWIIERFPRNADVKIQQLFAGALGNRGNLLAGAQNYPSDFQRAIGDFDAVLKYFSTANDATLIRQVALAFYHKGLVLLATGEPKAAAIEFEEAFRRVENAVDSKGREIGSKALLNRAKALDAGGDAKGADQCRDIAKRLYGSTLD